MSRTLKSQPRPHFFTLIELLVVVSIIAILAAMLLPALNQAKTKAKGTVCLGQLKQISLGFQLYQADADGYFPRYRRSDNANYTWMHTMSEYLGYLPYYRNTAGDPIWDSIWFCPESVLGSSHYRSLTTNSNLFKYHLSYAYPCYVSGARRGLGGDDDLSPAKITQIRSPSITMALTEVVSTKTVDTDTFYIPYSYIDIRSGTHVLGWHGGTGRGTNLLSVDGHVELYSNGIQLGVKFGDTAYGQMQAPFNTDWD
jgi:prepilin-type N-terminal cleavage/methylation domain-containing protein